MVSSSVASTEKPHNLNQSLSARRFQTGDVYVDGADEINASRDMIKGARCSYQEKIAKVISDKFICIVDGTKAVDVLGNSLPVEDPLMPVKPYVARERRNLRVDPVYRDGTTDNAAT